MLNQRKTRDSKHITKRRITELKKLQRLELGISATEEMLATLRRQHSALYERLCITEEFKKFRTVGSSGVRYSLPGDKESVL